MSAHTKKHPTKEVRIKVSKNVEKLFLVPKDKVEGILKLINDYEAEESTPWREVFKKEINDSSEAAIVLRASRTKAGLTQKELAKKLKTSQPNIAALENGSRSIGKELAKKLSKIFNTDYRVFL